MNLWRRKGNADASGRAELRLRLHRLDAGADFAVPADAMERLVVVMSGRCHMAVNGCQWRAVGRRRTVFFGAPYVAYVPQGSRLRIWNESAVPCELAVVSTRAGRQLEPWLATADQVEAAGAAPFAGRECAVDHGIILARAGVNTDRLNVGERMISPGTGAFIPFPVPRPLKAPDGLRALGHVVHYRLFPTAGHAHQWTLSRDAEPVETRTVRDGDSHVLRSETCATIAPPGTYVYYLWAAAVEAGDD